MKKFFDKNESKALLPAGSSLLTASTSNALSPPLLSEILVSPDMLDSPSFFIKDISSAMLERMFLQTCNKACASETQKQKEKKQEAVSPTV
jgi:hypothetical protein